MSFTDGTVVNIEAIADTDWVFDSWSGEFVSTNPIQTITMDANKTLTAAFSFDVSNQLFETTEISVYPNPTTDFLYFENINANSEYVVYDITGKAVISNISESSIEILDVKRLNPGIYFIQMTNDENRTNIKFIKQ
jgi:hypothetical protein